jgi:hypothetical protein
LGDSVLEWAKWRFGSVRRIDEVKIAVGDPEDCFLKEFATKIEASLFVGSIAEPDS